MNDDDDADGFLEAIEQRQVQREKEKAEKEAEPCSLVKNGRWSDPDKIND